MAMANIPPHEAARMDRDRDLRRRLNSIDPVTRYRAKEEIAVINEAEAGRIFAAKAKATEDAYFAELKRCEESDRATLAKFRQLPRGARTIK